MQRSEGEKSRPVFKRNIQYTQILNHINKVRIVKNRLRVKV